MKANLLGIGGQRCATTWLFQCLTEHPEICSNDGKEINFFSDYFHRGFEWYERYFSSCAQYKIRCDFSVSYLYNIQAPERAYHYNPDMKIIVCLRNPVERVLDQHLWHLSLGLVSGENQIIDKAIENNPTYIEQGLYYKYLKEWLRFFPLNQKLMPVIVDDIKSDSEKLIRKVYKFLEINSDFVPVALNRQINKATLHRFPIIKKFIRKTSGSIKKLGGKSLIDFLKKYNINGLVDNVNSKSSDFEIILDSDLREWVKKSFVEDNKRLSELIERDLSDWLT